MPTIISTLMKVATAHATTLRVARTPLPPYDCCMAVISEDEIDQRCTIAALTAAALHLLAIAAVAYQITAHSRTEPAVIYLVQFGWYCGPAILLLLLRRVCPVVVIPVVILFALRLHHVVVFWLTGINSMAVQKGDELGFFEMLFSLTLGAIALFWQSC